METDSRGGKAATLVRRSTEPALEGDDALSGRPAKGVGAGRGRRRYKFVVTATN